ncbi:MAG: hypothetical protein LC624_07720 [Halobacteriales archaeon]|nr:hypothetical protein [Halobacteriales archaeon]
MPPLGEGSLREPRILGALVCIVLVALTGCTDVPPNPNEPPRIPDEQAPPLGQGETVPSNPSPKPPAEPEGTNLVAPTGPAETMLISKAGGTITLPDGSSVEFPEGAVDSDTSVTLGEVPADSLPGGAHPLAVGPVLRLGPAGLMVLRPIEFKIKLHIRNLTNATSPTIPLLLPTPLNDTGEPMPAGDVRETIDVRNGTVEVHFADEDSGYVYIEAIPLRAQLNPYEVTAFLAQRWSASLAFQGPLLGGFHVANLTPVASGVVVVDDADLPSSISDATPAVMSFDCGAPGHGRFGASFDASAGTSEDVHVTILAPAHCVEDPELTADLQPPHTLYHVDAPLPDADEGSFAAPRAVYRWRASITCGVFEADGNRTVGPSVLLFQPSGPDASWGHPNVPPPPPDLSRQDGNDDHIPDYCPHNETAGFSHPGEIQVTIYYRQTARTPGDVQDEAEVDAMSAWSDAFASLFGGHVTCTYEGSLGGTGKCAGEMAENLPGEPPSEQDQ